jgi:hypothetical protein
VRLWENSNSKADAAIRQMRDMQGGEMNYADFIKTKKAADIPTGFDCADLGTRLFDFQGATDRWALKRGRAGIFADTGLGKTGMQVVWAQKVYAHTGMNVLIGAPLCVAQQTVEEAAKFGISVKYCRSQAEVEPGITITNYEMLQHFETDSFVGVVLDESSILKSHDSKTRQWIIDAFRFTPYKLSCTATPSPNDFMELGNQAEFLGVMSRAEMLAMFFTHDGGDTSQWRLKGHAKERFWEWMATWAICIRNPSDLGFDGSRYILPPLYLHEHVVASEATPGYLMTVPAQTLTDRREAKRSSLVDRVKLAADLANSHSNPCIVWCHLNDESTALAKLINGAVEVTGSMTPSEKERRIMDFTHGHKRVIVTKESIAGFGMNWQHCNEMIYAGMDDSFERFYQSLRRCYRFGQTRPVNAHLIFSAREGSVKENIQRKQRQHDEMAEQMVSHMREITKKQILGATSDQETYNATVPMVIPAWVNQNVEYA